LIETGSSWVSRLAENLDHVFGKMPGSFEEHPVDTFARHVWVHPFHEDDVIGLVNLVGEDHVLFGSDFPHPEGLREPLSFVKQLDGLEETAVDKIMGGNLRELLAACPTNG
jgi:predicted TIM-barrel fold metal-dependent hydrolase